MQKCSKNNIPITKIFTFQIEKIHQIRWIQTQTPCPFLDNGSCSIYQHRPLACRSHFSIRNPEQCHPQSPDFFKHPHKQRTLPMNCTKNYFKQGNTHKIFWEPVYGFAESTKQNLDHKMTDLNLYLHQQ